MGYKTVVQGSVVILIFAYIALGPYSSIYQQAIDQVKGPAEIAYRSVKNALYDIYLLATNPTEWYARQQVINSRPEKPISFPKALEISTLDVIPPSVPGGQPFVLNFVLKNEGDLPVQNVRMTAACNQWCSVPLTNETSASEKKFHLCLNDFLRNEIWCAESCDKYFKASSSSDSPKYTASECVSECSKNDVTIGGSVLGGIGITNMCRSKDAASLVENVYYRRDRYEREESEIVTVEPFVSKVFTGREAETRIAKIYLNVSFEHTTTSQLLTTIMSEAEKSRLIKENKLEFKPVVATNKVSPAKLSLNVGPQPLQAGKDATLLVSISNDRDESHIILQRGTKILITLPAEIGSGLNCLGSSTSARVYLDKDGQIIRDGSGKPLDKPEPETYIAEQYVYSVEPEPGKDQVDILPFEFNTVYVFLCKFTAKSDIDTLKTGLITANLTNYRFVHTITKDVPITTPIGIIFDPYEAYCNKCGGSTFDLQTCGKDECHKLSDTDSRNSGSNKIGKCYYEMAGVNACHSCGQSPTCEMFIGSDTCDSESYRCGLSCSWIAGGKHPVSGVDISGVCVSKGEVTPLLPSVASKKSTVRASREGLVGGTTASGHKIRVNDVFAALPDRSALNHEIEVTYKGKTIKTKVLDVGPWYIDDPYWTTGGTPQAEKDWQSKTPVSRGPQKGNVPTNGAGIDLADGLYYQLLGSEKDTGILEGVEWTFVVPNNSVFPGSELPTKYASQQNWDNIVQHAPARTGGVTPSYIVLHHTAGSTIFGALMSNVDTGNNEHYIVGKDGEVVIVVPEELSAQHANCMNSKSIGIEIVNKGDGSDPYPTLQIESLKNLVTYLIQKYNIPQGNLIGHGCTNSGKKADEPSGLDPNFLSGWTVGKREGSTSICQLLC